MCLRVCVDVGVVFTFSAMCTHKKFVREQMMMQQKNLDERIRREWNKRESSKTQHSVTLC